ncbi:MCE family protein [Nocardioides sp.]|uniref:MCE family protein n=1 Tax=Nocardioides sp. TaxID=35761 RepID=UPI0039E4AFA8
MSRRLLLPIVLGLILAVLLGVGLLYGGVPGRTGTELKARFSAAVGLYPGSEVRILGVKVGEVVSVTPDKDGVIVTLRLDHGQKAAADTGAVIVAPTMVSDRYVQLTKPYTGGTALRADAVISETGVPVEVDDMYASLTDLATQLGPDGANRNGALSRLLQVASDNLDGEGKDINQLIDEFGKATGTLADSDDDFFATVGNLDKLNEMLVAHDAGVASVNRQFADVTSYLADDSDDLAAAVANLGDALAVLDDFIKDNRKHLKNSVEKLRGPTRLLVKQKKSLEEAVKTLPLALQNFLSAYNPAYNTVDGRSNLNELTVWSTTDGLTARTSEDAPPVLLPGLGEDR